jgi:hypothetical protein
MWIVLSTTSWRSGNALVVLEEGRDIVVESLKFDDETAKGKISGR